MSQERFDWLDKWVGDPSDIIRTPGSESNVKEIYDTCAALDKDPDNIIFNQFCEFGNYVIHRTCTGGALEAVFGALSKGRPGAKLAAYVSASGSGGTLAAGDHLKKTFGAKIVAVEASECPTLLYNGFGEHNIQGIGDKHVPYIHNVMNTDLVAGVSDHSTDSLFVLFNTEIGRDYLIERKGIDPALVAQLGNLGLSGLANMLAAIKTAKYFDLGAEDVILTVATDGGAMYGSEIGKATAKYFGNRFDTVTAGEVWGQALAAATTDDLIELSHVDRKRIFNLGYFTWVEQQGGGPRRLHRPPAAVLLGRPAGSGTGLGCDDRRLQRQKRRRGPSRRQRLTAVRFVCHGCGATVDAAVALPFRCPPGGSGGRRYRSCSGAGRVPPTPQGGGGHGNGLPGGGGPAGYHRVRPVPPLPKIAVALSAGPRLGAVRRRLGRYRRKTRPGAGRCRRPRLPPDPACPPTGLGRSRRLDRPAVGQGRDRQCRRLAQGPSPDGRDALPAGPAGGGPTRRRRAGGAPAGHRLLRQRGPGRLRDRACRRLAVGGLHSARCQPRGRGRLKDLGAAISICRRDDGEAGDPCYHAFRRAVAAGAIAFGVQGPDNGLAIEGGRTLAFEMAEQLQAVGARPEQIFVQVGGGALASALAQGFAIAAKAGLAPSVPRLIAVQTEGCAPLARAWRRLDGINLTKRRPTARGSCGRGKRRPTASPMASSMTRPMIGGPSARVCGAAGGKPVVAPEASVVRAHRLARDNTGIAVSATGRRRFGRTSRPDRIGSDTSAFALFRHRSLVVRH